MPKGKAAVGSGGRCHFWEIPSCSWSGQTGLAISSAAWAHTELMTLVLLIEFPALEMGGTRVGKSCHGL